MLKLNSLLEGVKTVAIAGHVRPDGDCIGSCMGLYHYIRENFEEITVKVYLEPVPEKFSYIEEIENIAHELDQNIYELFFMLDCGDKERLGFAKELFDSAKKTICLDHHVSSKPIADENCIMPEAAATCEILFGLMDREKIGISSAMALYTGLIHDTGVFKHSNTTSRTMEAAAVLIGKGVPFTDIINNSFYEKTYVQNQILGRALLESIEFYHGRCIFAALRRKELDFYGANPTDLDGIVEQLILTKGIECAIFLYETDPQIFKVSMRSKKIINVSEIATRFGGGGHIHAAGCTMMGNEHDVINNISLLIDRQYQAFEATEKGERNL